MRFRTLSIGSLFCALISTAASAASERGAFPFLLAGTLTAEGEVADAEAAYAEALRASPDDPFVRTAFAELLGRTGRLAEAAELIAEARRLAPGEPGVLMTQGRIAMARAEREPASQATAIDAFEALAMLSPDDLEVWLALGQLHLTGGDAEKAVAALGRAAELRPDTPMIEALRAKALSAAGRLEAAERILRSMLEGAPARLDLRLDLAENLSSQGRHDEAGEVLADAPEGQRASPELRRRLAVERLLAGDLEAAGAVATPLLAEFPENSALRLLLASIRQADGEWGEVLSLVSPLASRPAVAAPVLSMQLRALRMLGRTADALAIADSRRAALADAGQGAAARALELEAAELAADGELPREAERRARALASPTIEPESAAIVTSARWILADLAIQREEWSAALAELAPLSSPGAAGRKYELLRRSGETARAEALAAEMRSGSADLHLALAEAEVRLERFEVAIALYREILARDAESLRARFGFAAALERNHLQEASEIEFERLLAQNPDHAPALNYLGYMRIEAGREIPSAVELVSRAVRIDPSNAAYVDSLGWGFHRLGQPQRAVQLLERAARLESSDVTILEHLGDALATAGDTARAHDVYVRALALSQPEEKEKLTAKLERLARPGGSS